MSKREAVYYIVVISIMAFLIGLYLGINNNKYKEIVQLNQSVPHMLYANNN